MVEPGFELRQSDSRALIIIRFCLVIVFPYSPDFDLIRICCVIKNYFRILRDCCSHDSNFLEVTVLIIFNWFLLYCYIFQNLLYKTNVHSELGVHYFRTSASIFHFTWYISLVYVMYFIYFSFLSASLFVRYIKILILD